MPAFLKKGKFIVYIMIFIFILFFTLDFGAVDLQKVAIVVTLGLDYESEEQNYILSGQIAVTDSASSFTASENQAVIYGTGKTPSMALKNMEDNSGWHPYISFCKLIIVSKSVFEHNIMDALDFFLRNEQLNDTALICATEEKAADILNSKTSLDEVSTFSLLKTLLYNGSENMNVVATNLKDFAVRYYNSSSGNVLTYIKINESVEAAGEGEEGGEEEGGGEKIGVFRGQDKMIQHNLEIFREDHEKIGIDRYCVCYTDQSEVRRAEEIAEKMFQICGQKADYITQLSPVLGSIGCNGAIEIAYVTK